MNDIDELFKILFTDTEAEKKSKKYISEWQNAMNVFNIYWGKIQRQLDRNEISKDIYLSLYHAASADIDQILKEIDKKYGFNHFTHIKV